MTMLLSTALHPTSTVGPTYSRATALNLLKASIGGNLILPEYYESWYLVLPEGTI